MESTGRMNFYRAVTQADGWWAEYKEPAGNNIYCRVICWAVTHEGDRISGMGDGIQDQLDEMDADNFVRYVHIDELKHLGIDPMPYPAA